jgi:putative ABC transport system ATP-binding protein
MPGPDDVVVALRAVTMAFGGGAGRVEALRGVSLEVRRGDFVAVTGPSGSGKSTMLHLMAGLARPTAGVVAVEGVDLASLDDDALTRVRRRRIGIVFQAFNLLPVLTALENVALPLELDGVPRDEAAARADRALARVGLSARAGHVPAELSGGEQQRVAVARALVTDPAVLLADEPTGNLDTANGATVMALLRALADDGATLVMVTHEPDDAARARRQVRLVDGRVTSDVRAAAPA